MPASSSSCASIFVLLGQNARDDVEGAARGEDVGISVVEVPELSNDQLTDGRKLWLWRYPEAGYGSHPSGSYWGGYEEDKLLACP